MPNVTERVITFQELRHIVMALYEVGKLLKQDYLPFSYGHVGNERQALARRIDELVSSGEPYQHFIIRSDRARVMEIDEQRREKQLLRNEIADLRERLDNIKLALETSGLDDTATMDVIADLRANFRPKVKKVKKCSTRKSK